LECGGGLIDAISMGVKAALADTKIPKVSVIGSDGGTLELELADESEGREEPLDWTMAPCLVTLNKVIFLLTLLFFVTFPIYYLMSELEINPQNILIVGRLPSG